jgi:two-component system sensor histidine kinase HydH
MMAIRNANLAAFLYLKIGMMMDKHKYRMFLSGFSPWIILGAVLVLLPIVALMTMENINRQKRQSIRLMMEKGAALIRSFEAGTRMGMRGIHGSGFQLQRLLIETAAQPDIAHLLVVGVDGSVLAHSRMDMVESHYGADLDLEAVHEAGTLAWRRTVSTDGEAVVEVFGKFAPLAKRSHRSMHGHLTRMKDINPGERVAPAMVIFVGFRTDAVDAARRADVRHTVVMAAILMLVGCVGVLLLSLTQNYRSARTSLAREKVFSDNLVSRMPIGLVAMDRNGLVTAVNSVAETTLGILADGVIGAPAGKVLPAILAGTLPDSDRPVEKEVRCPVADGRRIPMDVSAATLTDENGECFGQVILFKDLSEIRALHQELEKNRRLASVGRLAAGVAHEIRNPLSSIKGFATYFKGKYRESPKDQEIASIMIQEVDRLNRVVGQLLDFSRPIRLHFQQVALAPFFQDAFRLVDRQSRDAGVSMVLDIPEDMPAAFMDPDKMSQVMLNLLLNALDATAAGGRLTVRVRGQDDGGIRIAVIDTGAGIDPMAQPHIFEPYFSTKKTGTGLGLAIVHNIVKAHQGDIQADSRPGKGTAVHITLPAAKEA